MNEDTAKYIERWKGHEKGIRPGAGLRLRPHGRPLEITCRELGGEVVAREYVSLKGIDLGPIDLEVLGDTVKDAVRDEGMLK